MRLGFISPTDPADADQLSGMPTVMLAQLGRHFHVTPMTAASTRAPRLRAAALQMRRAIPYGLKADLSHFRTEARRVMDDGLGEWTEQALIRRAAAASRALERQIEQHRPDVLFGCCISTMIQDLRTSLPLVYFSDATARLINGSYPQYMKRGPAYHRACDRMEWRALHRAALVAAPSQSTRLSMIRDYGMPPERVRLAPMGANLRHEPEIDIAPPPTRRHLRLYIVAADPVRKRLDLAIETTALLRRQGVGIELTIIGPRIGRIDEPWLHWAGPLRLSNPQERRRHLEIIAAAHLLMLPSSGEAYGIAACEAAAAGRPAIVSAAGGLPEIIQDGTTGLVMPLRAGPMDYAHALMEMIDTPDRYTAMADAARRLARRTFNWDTWGDTIAELIHEAAAAAYQGRIVITPVGGGTGDPLRRQRP